MNAILNQEAADSTQTTAYTDYHVDDNKVQDILNRARQYAVDNALQYTGSISPVDAWALFQAGYASIVDVRTNEERKFVGYVENTLHVPWATGTAFNRNPRFAKELEAKVKKDQLVLLLCRSGNRSAYAAEAAHKAGFQQIYNILEGFEGDLNDARQRGHFNGWRHRHLPWVQD